MDQRNQYPDDRELSMFIAQIESEGMRRAPDNLKESILRQAESMSVQVVKKKREFSKSMQLFLYSLKVCSAIVWVLLLLNLSSYMASLELTRDRAILEPEISFSSVINDTTENLAKGVQRVTSTIEDFSIQDLKMW